MKRKVDDRVVERVYGIGEVLMFGPVLCVDIMMKECR
jgi:hypothetical protein